MFQLLVIFFINFYHIFFYNLLLINMINLLELIDNFYFDIFIFSFFLNTLCFSGFYSFNFYYLLCFYYMVFIFMLMMLLFCLYFYYENSINESHITFLTNTHCKSKMIGYLMEGFGFGWVCSMFIFINLFLFIFFYLPCLFLFFFIILVFIISPTVFFINSLYILKIEYLESKMWEFKIFNSGNFCNMEGFFKNFSNNIYLYYFFLCWISDFFNKGVFILFEFSNEFVFIFIKLFLFVFFILYFKYDIFNIGYKLYIFNCELSCGANYFFSFIFSNISTYKFFFSDVDFFKSLYFNFMFFSNIIKTYNFIYFYLFLFIFSFYVNFNFLFISNSFFSFILLVLIVKNVSSLYDLTIKYFKFINSCNFYNIFSNLYFFILKFYKLNKGCVLFCVLGLGDSFLYFFYYFHNFFISWKFQTCLNVFITSVVLDFKFCILFIQKLVFMVFNNQVFLSLNWFPMFEFYIFIQKFGLIIVNFMFLFYMSTNYNYFIFTDILYFFFVFFFSFFDYCLFIPLYYNFYFKMIFQLYMFNMLYFNYFLYIVYFTMSLDVMHSISWDFVNWGSRFGFKLDVMPGKINYFFLDCFDISFILYSLTCFEFCGLYHSYMKLDCLFLYLDIFMMFLLWDS